MLFTEIYHGIGKSLILMRICQKTYNTLPFHPPLWLVPLLAGRPRRASPGPSDSNRAHVHGREPLPRPVACEERAHVIFRSACARIAAAETPPDVLEQPQVSGG